MSLTLIDGVVTEVTPNVYKTIEFLRSECERLNGELAAINAACERALNSFREEHLTSTDKHEASECFVCKQIAELEKV